MESLYWRKCRALLVGISLCIADASAQERPESQEGVAEAERARQHARWAALSQSRADGLARQFKPLRMVITTPCLFWGIDPVVEQDLKRAGMYVLAYPDVPKLANGGTQVLSDWDSLSRYNVIIFGESAYAVTQMDPQSGAAPEKIRRQVPLLRRFLAEGGGIWFCGLGEYDWGNSAAVVNYILKELDLGTEVASEVVVDASAGLARSLAGEMIGNYAWSDISRDPLAQGVENLLHPTHVVSSFGSLGVIPIAKLSPEWRVLVAGKSTAASFAVDRRHPEGKTLLPSRGVATAPVLAAVRQVGKGRVVLWPTWSAFTVTGGSGGQLIDGERDGKASDGARLIENMLCWLAEPSQGSQTIGTFEPAKAKVKEERIDPEALLEAWCVPGRKMHDRQFRGLIGAHSSLSDGVSAPEALVSAAKRAGYQWLAFTENFAKMDEGKWKKLLETCDQVNKLEPGFRAYPGLDFLDEAGNRGVVFGHRYWIKDSVRSEGDPSRVKYWKGFTYDADADPSRWPPRVIIRSKTNNKRPWNQGLWTFLSAYSYEGGKLVDDSADEYPPLVHRHRFIYAGIMTVHTVYSVDEVASSAQRGLWQTWVRAESLEAVLGKITGATGPKSYFPAYISEGPEIEDFQSLAVIGITGHLTSANEVTASLPGNRNFKVHVRVRSPIGLRTVEVFHNNRLAARFGIEGNEFDKYLTFHSDVESSTMLVVTDREGRRATSWANVMLPSENRVLRSSDNQNWMRGGNGQGTLLAPRPPYSNLETQNGWSPRTQREASSAPQTYGFMAAEEVGSYGLWAAFGECISPVEIRAKEVLVNGQPWGGGVGGVMTMDFDTIGKYGMVYSSKFLQDYPTLRKDVHTGIFANEVRVVPSPWPTVKHVWIPFLKPDGAKIARFSGTLVFAEKVSTTSAAPLRCRLGTQVKPLATTLEVMNPDGSLNRYTVGTQTVNTEVPQGGFACWYDARGAGVGGLIALTPGIQCSYSRELAFFHVPIASPIEPGTKVDWDAILVSGNTSTTNSDRQMIDVWRGLGIAGTPTHYRVKPELGKIVDQKFFLTVQANDGGFSGQISKALGHELPIHLPVLINGLNPRWDAGLWYRGKTQLHTVRRYADQWGARNFLVASPATYESRTDEIRSLPIFESGTGYCQIETEQQDAGVFLGNFLVCDQSEAFITLVKSERNQCVFEINNPTERTLVANVRPSKGFEYTGNWNRKVTLNPGGWQRLSVP